MWVQVCDPPWTKSEVSKECQISRVVVVCGVALNMSEFSIYREKLTGTPTHRYRNGCNHSFLRAWQPGQQYVV